MVIDNNSGFDTEKDELVWAKIISIFPLDSNNSKNTHVVKYYKTDSNEEYYLFEYVMACNNGTIVNNFNKNQWKEVVRQIDFSNNCYIYSQDVTDLNCFVLMTMGGSINIKIEEFLNGQKDRVIAF